MQVETKNASLDTMAVTIQALHVSGKQMTLAVFRQLPIALAFNDSGELRDLDFWGLVRYQIKDEASLWAVASAGGILYRCDAAPRGHSIATLERDEASARSELKKYMTWEPRTIAWNAWRSQERTDWTDSNEASKPTIPHPEYERNFKIGEEEFYADELLHATATCAAAKTREQSIAKMAALPQLFIAV